MTLASLVSATTHFLGVACSIVCIALRGLGRGG